MEPSFEPRATDHIAEMINIIETLIEKNYAYVAENNVLFSSNKFSKYGSLSGKKLEEMVAGSRVDVESYKQEASDFILWKPSKDNEPGWDSPWGKGRPGWHIECSAMSEKLLGKTFDIHGGGQDLIFPHHENEIAQSECANGEKFANYWVHNGFVTVEGNKMAKSDGNFVTVNELKEKYQGEVIRFTMILTHYRQPLNWTNDNLQESKKTLDKWYQYFSEVDFKPDLSVKIDENVMNALNDDMNTPQAIAELHKLFKNCKSNDHDSLNKFLISAQFLGLMNDEPSEWLSWNKDNISVDQNKIESLIAQRNTARANKDFAEADRIRDELENLGIVLEDKGAETTWKTK